MALIIFVSIYAVLILTLAFGFARLEENDPKAIVIHSISVIVPVRNEKDLSILINSLAAIDYPTEKWEVIVVDDHSDEPVLPFGSIKVLRSELPGKKAAITEGIQQATGEIIVTTDGDCRVNRSWLTRINRAFQNPVVKMVVGGVRIEENRSFFSKLQALEFVSVAATSAATLGLGFPTMCNGANLSYRKAAFFEVNGFEGNEKISSGDDEFLMNKFRRESVRYLYANDAIVTSLPEPRFVSFVNQRLRWAGKWGVNTSLATRIFAVIIFFFHLSFVPMIIGAVMGLKFFLWLLLAKAFVEAIFLIPAANFFGVRWRWIPFIVLQLVYSPYVIIVGLLSQVVSPKWKGRVVETKV